MSRSRWNGRAGSRLVETGLGVLVLVLALATSPPALALTVVDVIQLSQKGYSDRQIVELIEATSSAFELEAEDLPRLKQLGVSEPVIRAMLERLPAETAGPRHHDRPSGGPEGAAAEPASDHEHERTGSGKVASSDSSSSPADRLFSYQSFPEKQAGHHLHFALALSGVKLIILRDEAGHSSVEDRARDVALRLEVARARGDGVFHPVLGGRQATVAFRGGPGQQTLAVLTVTAGDAQAYERRSGRRVDPNLLAAYWADLLTDFWAINLGKPPSRLLALHDGDSLGLLYQALKNTEDEGGLRIEEAAKRLTSSVQHHLERLASAVPSDYRGGTGRFD